MTSKLAQCVRLSRLFPEPTHPGKGGGENVRVHEQQLVPATLEQATAGGDRRLGAGPGPECARVRQELHSPSPSATRIGSDRG
jgi:hypothetical protein